MPGVRPLKLTPAGEGSLDRLAEDLKADAHFVLRGVQQASYERVIRFEGELEAGDPAKAEAAKEDERKMYAPRHRKPKGT